MKLKDEQVYYLNGLLDAFDDMSDGAWQSCCEDAIRACGEFKGKDPFDVWMAWVKATSLNGSLMTRSATGGRNEP